LSYIENSFKDELATVLEEIGEQHCQELSRFYPSMVKKGLAPSNGNNSHPPSEEFLLFEAFLQFFVHVSRIKPLVIAVENMQWADSATKKLLNYMARSISHERILIVALRRTDSEHSADLLDDEDKQSNGNIVERIQLKNLTREESFLMIEGLMGRDDLPDYFLENMYDRTAGNPLFLEEMIKYLKRENYMSFDEDSAGKMLSVPGSITEMLKGQADAIQEDKRQILAMASVIGSEFSFDLLMLLSLKNEGFLLDVMDEALKQRIIREIPHPGEDRYSFVNPLFQQVLYESINKRKRRNLHRKVGGFLEKYYFDQIEELYGDLSFQFHRSGDLLKALKYTVMAADKAAALFANQEAIGYYERAIEIISSSENELQDMGLWLELMEKKADIHDLIGEFDTAENEYEDIRETLVRENMGKERQAQVLGKLGVVLDKKGESEKAIDILEQGMEITDKSNGEITARILSSLADIYLRQRELDRSIKCCMQGLSYLDQNKESAVGAQIYMTIGGTYLEKGEVEKGKGYMRQGIKIFDSIGDLKGLGKAFLSMGTLYYIRGEYQKAEKFYKKSRNLASRTGNATLLMSCYNNLGMIARISGDIKEAVNNWDEGLSLAEKVEHFRSIAYLKNNLGNTRRELGDYSAAQSLLNESLKLFKQMKSDIDIRRTNRGLAILHLRLGDLETAEAIIRLNDKDVGESHDDVDRLMDKDVLARIFVERGNYEDAELLLLKALEGYRKGGDPEDISHGLLTVAELYVRVGDHEKAAVYLDEGEEMSQKTETSKLVAFSYLIRGISMSNQKDWVRALPLLKKAYEDYDSLDIPYFKIIACHALGGVYENKGEEEKAKAEFQKAKKLIILLQQKIHETRLQQSFIAIPRIADILSKA
jgi:tetratricopeptide (TPR) repeat protein